LIVVKESYTVIDGRECHIECLALNGPRHNPSLSEGEADAVSNLILLCEKHHTEIDSAPEAFPASRLFAMKGEHEDAVTLRLEGTSELLEVEAYTRLLTEELRRLPIPTTLFASIGEGDFATSWLGRVFEGLPYKSARPFRISRFVVKRLSEQAVASLTAAGNLDLSFGARLEFNLERVRAVLAEAGVPLEVRFWDDLGLPPFHGWVVGDLVLRNRWARGTGGHWHALTPMMMFTRSKAPAMHELTLAEFL